MNSNIQIGHEYDALKKYIENLHGNLKTCLTVSIVGGGGKTSLLFALVNQFKETFNILITTTTMMYEPQEHVDMILYQDHKSNAQMEALLYEVYHPISQQALEPSVKNHKAVAIFKDRIKHANMDHLSGVEISLDKVRGIESSLVNRLKDLELVDLILVEADGAKRKPLKAYAMHEPVIPNKTDLVMVVLGLSGLNKSISEETIHRLPEFLKLTSKDVGEQVVLEDLLSLFTSEKGFLKAVPKEAKVLVVLNQADCVDLEMNYDQFSKNLIAMDKRIDGVLVTSLKQNEIKEMIMR